MEELPIFELRERLRDACRRGVKRIVLQAPTGSGKSTQVPQMLLDDALVPAGTQIVVLQPRRLPTRMLAARIARERSQQLGSEVGYQIRFDRVESAETRIKFVTEGLLLRQLLGGNARGNALGGGDGGTKKIGAIIFDEFHERHLYSDLTLAFALELQRTTHPELLIIVMSATLDTAALSERLAPCETLSASGRLFPIAIDYFPSSGANGFAGTRPRAGFLPRYAVWEHAAAAFRKAFHDEPDGDFLVFMPGVYEISKTIEAISGTPEGRACVVLPLYGELSADAQDRAVAPAPAGTRKVVVATNVAETSLTIPGVRVVIDSGLARILRYDPHRGINMLLIENISQSSADQRAGRAGRTAPGRCVRLWSRREHERRAARDVPEIRRVELSEIVLLFKAGGVSDLASFPWFEKPESGALEKSEELLRELGALDAAGTLTPTGAAMARFPLHPRYARMFIAANELGCLRRIAFIAALAQGRDIQLELDGRRKEAREELLGETDSDFFHRLTLLGMARKKNFDTEFCRRFGIHAGAARQANRLAEQFLKIAEKIFSKNAKFRGVSGTANVSGTPSTAGTSLAALAPDGWTGSAPRRADEPSTNSAETPSVAGTTDSAGTTQIGSDEAVRRCILLGFVSQLARRVDAGTLRCRLVHGRSGELRRACAVRHAKLLVASEIEEIQTRGEVCVFLSLATAVEESWLEEYFPGDFSTRDAVEFDAFQKRVITRRERVFRGLVLGARELPDFPSDAASRLLADEVLSGRLALEKWDSQAEAWINKVNFAASRCPELGIAPIDAAGRRLLVEELCAGATSYKDIREKSVWKTLHGWLTREQEAAMERLLPDTVSLPRRRHPAKIVYTADGEAVVGATVQELYDCPGSRLRICGGKVPLVIEVQSPARRTFQRTSDLDAFWKTSYEQVKKELRGRYPKHEWR